jgi:hypothetical protein
MATPMTAAQQVAQFNKWDIDWKGYENWQTHNRNHVGSWGPVNGLVIHHTGSDSKDQRDLLRNGYRELPGPLCHYGIAQDGTLWLIGNGRANHAGSGDDEVFRAVVDENYGDKPPVDNETNTDGNRHFYGVEIWYSGSHEMTDAQYYTLMRLAAAICDFHGWTEKSCIAHGEWQPGKWDPGYKSGQMMNMANVRKDILTTIRRGPKLPMPPVDNPPPSGTKVPVDTKSQAYKEVWETDAAINPPAYHTDKNPTSMPISMLTSALQMSREARDNTIKIMKHLGIN